MGSQESGHVPQPAGMLNVSLKIQDEAHFLT